MGVRRIWGYAVVVAIVVFVFVMMTGCGSEPSPDGPAPGPSVSASASQSSQGPLPSQRWAEMDPAARTEVCSKLSGPLPGEGEIGGAGDASSSPDFREALWALETKGGLSQSEATAMLPYALKQCR